MKQQKDELKFFADRVASYCMEAPSGIARLLKNAQKRPFLKRGVHIPLIQIPKNERIGIVADQLCPLLPPASKSIRKKQLSLIQFSLADRVSLASEIKEKKDKVYYIALETNSCCQGSDLHLLHYHKVYEENHPFRLRKIRGWKLPCFKMTKQQINQSVSQFKDGTGEKPKMNNVVIDLSDRKEKEEEEKSRFSLQPSSRKSPCGKPNF